VNPDFDSNLSRSVRESAQMRDSCAAVARYNILDHVHDAIGFIHDNPWLLPTGGRQIISWLNMRMMLERRDPNSFNFEQTAYLPEHVVANPFERKGF